MTITDRINSWIDYANGWLHGISEGHDWVVLTLIIAVILIVLSGIVKLFRRR